MHPSAAKQENYAQPPPCPNEYPRLAVSHRNRQHGWQEHSSDGQGEYSQGLGTPTGPGCPINLNMAEP